MKIKDEIEKLKEIIRKHDYNYYVLNQPTISDTEYDALFLKLKNLETKYPEYQTVDSPSQRISGNLIKGFKTLQHKIPMLSLDNSYDAHDIIEWDKRIRKIITEDIKYFAELKIDGLGISLIYEKGILKNGLTRGDGVFGEDVTENIKTIKSIPLKLFGDYPEVLEVRGEIFMTRKNFYRLNEERKKNQEELFSNPRNSASGSLKLLDPGEVAKRKLDSFIYLLGYTVPGDYFSGYIHSDIMKYFNEIGFKTNKESKLLNSIDEVINFYNYWVKNRESVDYEIDGLVIKVNSFLQQKILGETMRSPRWAIAFKFPAKQATTKINEIIFQVGRTGVITPVAVFEPVEIGGAKISRATLHNFDEIARLEVKLYDTVLVERSGDVIPKVVKVITSARKGNEQTINIPVTCPVCNSKIIKEKEEDIAYRCINISCPAQLKEKIIHFAAKDAMDIEGLGGATVEQLLNKKMIKKFSDLYRLKNEDLLKLELFKEKKAKNLLTGIENSKKGQLSKFIFGLGIRHIGEKASITLADRFKNIEKLLHVKKTELENIPEFGPIIINSVYEFFNDFENVNEIKTLISLGINPVFIEKKGEILKNKTFVFTGELKKYSRKEAEEKVRLSGGKNLSAVSRKVDYVVAGENPGSKYEKAKELNLRIISENEFNDLLGEKK